jgi:hypothetical protein
VSLPVTGDLVKSASGVAAAAAFLYALRQPAVRRYLALGAARPFRS